MLNHDYIHQVQAALTKHYQDDISNQDEHRVTIYTNPESDNALITYHPYNLDDPADNDGKVMPIRDVITHAIARGDQWVKLTNQQFIQSQRTADGRYQLNFNFRHDNAISATGAKKLRQDLLSFKVQLTPTGLLVTQVDDSATTAFAHLIKAIQFINANGYNYIESQSNP